MHVPLTVFSCSQCLKEKLTLFIIQDKLLEEADDFYDFRLRSADLVRDVVYLVGATKCFGQLFSMLNQEGVSPSWDVTEATLFIMAAVAKHIDV